MKKLAHLILIPILVIIVHDALLEQAELARKAKRRKLDFLQQEYAFIDDPPAFVNPTFVNNFPPSLTGRDRVILKAHYENLEDRERNALQKARFFRDRCGQLEQKCLQLKYRKHKEVEGTRYFWRNVHGREYMHWTDNGQCVQTECNLVVNFLVNH